jgi:hypothetical protein
MLISAADELHIRKDEHLEWTLAYLWLTLLVYFILASSSDIWYRRYRERSHGSEATHIRTVCVT